MPEVSFVIPYYHKLKSIHRCLKSLFNQSVKDIEVIVVFDGPDPEAERIVRKFKHVKVVTIPHGGAPAARNAGAKIATGKYISFWDADCYIESGAVQAWLIAFRKYPDVDFVYAGYRFLPEGNGGIASEPFDPWLLQINNYISGMFPIKREKAPKWDESLKSLQDWDFWLTAVKNGCKGFRLEGYSFKTDFPEPKSISGIGCRPENWLDRLETVKKKHGIPLRDICVCSLPAREDGLRIAKMIGADYRDYPTYFPNRYKTIIQLGFSPRHADVHSANFKNPHAEEQPKRILFWRAQDIYSLRNEAAIAAVEALAITLNNATDYQFCEDKLTKDALQKLGFRVVMLPLPLDFADEPDVSLPPKLKVLMDVEPEYAPVFESIERAIPDVEFKKFEGAVKTDDYSVIVKFCKERSIDTSVKKMLLSGRRVISNIQAPFCGFVSSDESIEKTRKGVIAKLRELQDVKDINKEAQKFYREACSPKKFIDVLETVCKIRGEKKELAVAK